MYSIPCNQSQNVTRFNSISTTLSIHKKSIGLYFVNFIVLLCVIYIPGKVFASYLALPKDTSGWTIFTPSSDSRILYVDPDDADEDGTIYTSTSLTDPFNPGAVNAFKTYAAAYAQTRDNYPDWILVKRGKTLTENIGRNIRMGRSASEPFLIGSYGSAGNSPIFKTSQTISCISTYNKSNIVVFGIDFYSYTRNPLDPGYVANSDVDGISILAISNGNIVENVLFEGCKFRFYATNINIQSNNGGELNNIVIRRSLILDSYSATKAHASGFYALGIDVIVSECIFDHNGWYSQAGSGVGQATLFNHNFYAESPKSSDVQGNIFLRASSIGTKFTNYYTTWTSNTNNIISNNLYVDGEVGISLSTDAGVDTHYNNVTISNNVFSNIGGSKPTNREGGISYGLDLGDIDNGSIENNLIINQNDASIDNGNFAIKMKGLTNNVDINNNVLYNLKNTDGLVINSSYDGRTSSAVGMKYRNNSIIVPGYLVSAGYDPSTSWTFSGNKYFSDKTDGTRFSITSFDKTDAEWVVSTGDNSTFIQQTFPDSTRSIETYMQYLGETATIDAFIAICRSQDRYNWDNRFTAEQANTWIKAGFWSVKIVAPFSFRVLTN